MREIRNTFAKVGVGLMLTLVTCMVTFAQDVTTNAMPGTDFSKYHTYKWVTIAGATPPNQIVDAQIKSAVDSQLATKGLTKTDGDKADLYIGYQLSVDQEKQWNAYNTGGVRWGGGMATATSSNISVGTLVLDMYDPSNKQLVWSGRATKTIDPGNSQEKKQKNLDKAMQKLLKDFPPKQK
ncbi:MAG TPA: DUF4136 domain-containing protein [Edaphobacter sp.]|nr:DUF4136 domain-containing protein [Edaphobacter sp.]